MPDRSRRHPRLRSGTLLVVLGAALGAACARAREEAPPATLRFHNLSEPRTLDPAGATGIAEKNLLLALSEGLAAFDPRTGAPVPGVAERWEVSEDGLRWTFFLRPCAWSNGDPLTAHDFVASWLRVLAPETASPLANLLWEIEGARAFTTGEGPASAVGIEAPDARTLTVRLLRPMPWLAQLAASSPLVPVHLDSARRAGAFVRGDLWVGNGPFVLEERVPNFRIVMRRNPRYWDADRVAVDRIVAFATESKQAAVDAFRAGRTDWVDDFPAAQASSWRGRPELRTSPYLATYFLRCNVTRPPLDDRRVRRALHLAIDRAAICERVLGLGQRPSPGFVPRSLADTTGYVPAEGLGFDPVRARALLAEAGFPGGAGFPRLPYQFDTNEDHARIAEAIQAMLREHLGIDVWLVNQEKKAVLDDEQQLRYGGLSRGSWIADYVDPMTFLEVFGSESRSNRTGFASADYDRLLAAARACADPERRLEILRDAERLLVEIEHPILPIYEYVKQTLVNPARIVGGFHENPLGFHPMRWIRLAS